MRDGTTLLRFEDGTPRLQRWAAGDWTGLPLPEGSGGGEALRRLGPEQLIACLPDSLLTVLRPEVGQARSRRQRLQAAQVQLQNLFPEVPGGHREILLLPGQDVLLAFLHPEGHEFLQRHAVLLDAAGVWTTSCLLGYVAGRAAGLTHFCWPGDDGHWLVASPQAVTVAVGGEAGAQTRRQLLGEDAAFVTLGWPEVMAGLEANPPAFHPPDLALRRQHSAASAPWKPAALAAVSVSLAALFLLAAGLYRWQTTDAHSAAWTLATQRMLNEVLPTEAVPPGSTQYATLRELVQQRRGAEVESLALLRLLDLLSEHAVPDPEALQLLRLHFSGGSGTLTFKTRRLNDVQDLIAAINGLSAGYLLTLEHIEKRPADMLVSVTLRMEG